MIRWAALLLALMASPLAARDVGIRSGEHETFSRLVIAIGESVDWSLDQVPDGYMLSISDPRADYDTGTVFDRIPKDRIAALEDLGQGRLSIRLACTNCHADAFLWQAGRLVVDVIDGSDPDRVENPADRFTLPLFAGPPARTVSVLPGIFEETENPSEPEGTGHDLAGLAEGIARAVSQGLLEPRAVVAPGTTEPIAEAIPPTPQEPESEPVTVANLEPGVSVGTALDRELSSIRSALTHGDSTGCLGPNAFAVWDWASSAAFVEQVADLRGGLSVELDLTDSEAARRAVRGYIHFGFGLEALMLVDEIPGDDPDVPIMKAMAALLDGIDHDMSALGSQIGCDNGSEPWLLMSGQALVSDVDMNAVIRNFRLLPDALQAHLAVPLARVLIEAEALESAELVLASLDGRDAAQSADAREVIAELAETLGQPEAALDLLERHVDDHARATPKAVIDLIRLALDHGHSPDREHLILAAALRQELGSTEGILDLARAEVLGWSALGDHDRALAILSENAETFSVSELSRLRSNVVNDLTRDAADMDFLSFVYRDDLPEIEPDAENLLAERLIALGFPDRALAFLSGPASREEMAERRYLRAEALIALDRHDEALLHIQGLTDDRAARLRADALAALGDHRAALSASPTESDPVRELRAEAWNRLASADDDLLRQVANDRLSGSPAEFEGLADRQAALDGSIEIRQRVEDMLQRFPAPYAMESD